MDRFRVDVGLKTWYRYGETMVLYVTMANR